MKKLINILKLTVFVYLLWATLFTIKSYGQELIRYGKLSVSYENTENVEFTQSLENTLMDLFGADLTEDDRDMFKMRYIGRAENYEYWSVSHNYLPYTIEVEKPYGYKEYTIVIKMKQPCTKSK